MSYRKVGGLHFVKVWRFGFTFYLARRGGAVNCGAIVAKSRNDCNGPMHTRAND